MYTKIYCITFILSSFLKIVTSHGGHGDGLETKNAIKDALLSYLCRGANGFPCNGHGSCSAGKCTCFSGYSGLKCEYSDDGLDILGPTDVTSGSNNNVGGINLHDLLSTETSEPQIIACVMNNENTCNGHGLCREGSCLCETGYSGLTCELSPDVGFCHTYKECAECTALMTTCSDKCSMMANFKLVFGFSSVQDESTFRKCRFRNSALNCTFYFQQESESSQGVKNIIVKACLAHRESTTNANETLDQLKDKPLHPVTSSTPSTVVDEDQSNAGTETPDSQKEDPHRGHEHGDESDTGKQSKYPGGSGTSLVKPELLLALGSIFALAVRI